MKTLQELKDQIKHLEYLLDNGMTESLQTDWYEVLIKAKQDLAEIESYTDSIEDKFKLLLKAAKHNGFTKYFYLVKEDIRIYEDDLEICHGDFESGLGETISINDIVSLDFLEALCKAMPYVEAAYDYLGDYSCIDRADCYKLSEVESIMIEWSLLREGKLEYLFETFKNLVIDPKEFDKNFNLMLDKYYTVEDDVGISKITGKSSLSIDQIKVAFRRNYFTAIQEL